MSVLTPALQILAQECMELCINSPYGGTLEAYIAELREKVMLCTNGSSADGLQTIAQSIIESVKY